MSAPDFDARAQTFTDCMSSCSRWKHAFMGAAYSTRLAKAILLAESAIREAKQLLAEDGVDLAVYGLGDPEPSLHAQSQDDKGLLA